ncbi:MAG: hypothetical protein KDD55_13120, partial [Bdellovibrionales bacterium]|nr:hypothetical protein [Bdellovibrionales bacterium]
HKGVRPEQFRIQKGTHIAMRGKLLISFRLLQEELAGSGSANSDRWNVEYSLEIENGDFSIRYQLGLPFPRTQIHTKDELQLKQQIFASPFVSIDRVNDPDLIPISPLSGVGFESNEGLRKRVNTV